MATTTTYTVKGMTCDHCVNSVKEEVSEVAGVTQVEVDLATGLLTVNSESPIDSAKIVAAVEEAGYEVANQA
jgi:copper chaperone